MAPTKSIFSDRSGRRRRLVNVGLVVLLALFGGGTALLSYSLLDIPILSHLSDIRPEEPRLIGVQDTRSGIISMANYNSFRHRSVDVAAAKTKRFAFVNPGYPGSFQSLKDHLADIDGIFIEPIVIDSTSGVVSRPDQSIKGLIQWLRSTDARVQIYAELSTALTDFKYASLMANLEQRESLVQSIVALKTFGVDGVVFDLPELYDSANNLITFLTELQSALHSSQMKLILGLDGVSGRPIEINAASHADYILVRTHDAIGQSGTIGPLASQGWFEAQLDDAVTLLGAEKLIFTIGSYAVDWNQGGRRQEISVQRAWNLMGQAAAKLDFNPESLNCQFSYSATDGKSHKVWFLDGTTVFNQVRAALSVEPAAVALWSLGLEDPSAWTSFGRTTFPNADALTGLRNPGPMSMELDLGSAGSFGIYGDLENGERQIDFDEARGLIVGQHMSKIPRSFAVARWGGSKAKTVALTFDDGPDSRYTPQILDILKREGVKATFFMIGANAVRNADIVKRVYREGHDIGNHSYSHSDMFGKSVTQIEIEFNAMQRVLESQLGIRTLMLRPPYMSESAIRTDDGMRVFATAGKLGYITMRSTIDPNDWAMRTAQQISSHVIDEASIEEEDRIILLHDSGGSRIQTILALPQIITTLKRLGYRFVSAHEMMGMSRSEAMPTVDVSATSGLTSHIATFELISISRLMDALRIIAVLTAVLGGLRLLFIVGYALRHRSIERHRARLHSLPQRIAVLVPAYNEEKVICKTIDSLLNSKVEPHEIIVVDDGSSDETALTASERYADQPLVRVFRKPNGGKSSALNFALTQTNADVIVALDADTVFEPEAIGHLVRHFADDSVGAVAGRTVVGNEISLITRFQSLEYITSQNLDRRAFELLNAIGVVPGAIGAWRREALLAAGGFPDDTLAEDADATIALQRLGFKVLYEHAAVAHTEAPETIRAFLKQRFRWMFGTLQVAFKHRQALLTATPRGVGLITIPNTLLFQFAFTLLAPLLDFILVGTVLTAIHEGLTSQATAVPDGLLRIAVYWAAFQVIDLVVAAIALRLNGGPMRWQLMPLIVLQRFCYRQLLYFVAARTLLAALKGQFVGWGKLLRTGNVPTVSQIATYQ
ncbi:MAG: polysaccharide deacetylase family protein [Hyphomicrobium sp.]